MIVDIECIPQPLGTPGDQYKHVEAAIVVAQRSGLKYVVNPMSTSIEGPADAVWVLLRTMHDACLASGAEHVITIIKVGEDADADKQPTIDGLTGKFQS